MSNSQESRNNYFPGNRYANVVATVSVALGLLLWGVLYNKLDQLDCRLRTVEQAVCAMQAIQNSKKVGLNSSLEGQAGRLFAPGLIQTP